jgi:hypothetical protein
MFTAGLCDWVGAAPPAPADLANHGVLAQGSAHIKTIVHTGGQVLGCRPLRADNLQADEDPESTWGYVFIVALAERHFAR